MLLNLAISGALAVLVVLPVGYLYRCWREYHELSGGVGRSGTMVMSRRDATNAVADAYLKRLGRG